MQLRLADPSDGRELSDLYRPYVEKTAISFETTVPTADEMARRVADTLPTYPWLVTVEGDDLLGYAYAHRFAPRGAYDWSVETSVYVRPDTHRSGVGRALYAALFEIVEAQGYREAFAGIALPNEASVGFHESLGFGRVATYERVGWKLGSWHDVGWWQRSIGETADAHPVTPQTLEQVNVAALLAGRHHPTPNEVSAGA